MASFHDRFFTNREHEENGTEVDLGGGLKITVRALDSAHSMETRRKLEEPHAALIRSQGKLPDDIAEQIMLKQLANSIVIGWEGVTEKDGTTPIAFSAANAERVFKEYKAFRQEVASVVMDKATWKKAGIAADAGN